MIFEVIFKILLAVRQSPIKKQISHNYCEKCLNLYRKPINKKSKQN